MQRRCSTKRFPRKKKRYEKTKTRLLHCKTRFSNKTCHFLHEQLDPKRLKKDLPELLKLIKGEDRVLIIGTTKDPHSADVESLCKMYTKIILIPRPDYSSRYGINTEKALIICYNQDHVCFLTEGISHSSSFVGEADQKGRRGGNRCFGPQLPRKDHRRLHSRSHGPGHPERANQKTHPAADQETTDCCRVHRSAGQTGPRVSDGGGGAEGKSFATFSGANL